MSVQFVFLVLPDIHLMDLAGPDQTIHEAADFGASFEIQYCGTGEKVVSSAGLPIDRLVHYSKSQDE
jgi:transcriptional regulator GlxA family with amidase domain